MGRLFLVKFLNVWIQIQRLMRIVRKMRYTAIVKPFLNFRQGGIRPQKINLHVF